MAQTAFGVEEPIRDSLFLEIRETLGLLPDKLRQVFVRNHYRGKDVHQISEELHIPEEEVRSLIDQANRVFRKILKRRHRNPSDHLPVSR